MMSFLASLLIVLVAPFGAADTKLGTGVTVAAATPIAVLLERPAEYVGKTVRVDGVATAVCAHMGCWMAVAPEGDTSGATVRLKVEDGVIVFPMTAKGRHVSAEGVFEIVGEAGDSTDAAAEHASVDTKASRQYQLKATGAIIQDR